MSAEIKVNAVIANQGIVDMRSSANAVPSYFTKFIEGENESGTSQVACLLYE